MKNKINIDSEHKLNDLTDLSASILPVAKQLLGLNGMLWADLISEWHNIIGAQLAQFCVPYKIKFPPNERTGGCLTIMTETGAFALEIQQHQKKIIENVNIYFGYPAIAKIKIIQNKLSENTNRNKKTYEQPKKNIVSPSEQTYITEITNDITDKELRDTLYSLGNLLLTQKK